MSSDDDTNDSLGIDTKKSVLARDLWSCQLCRRVGSRRFPDDAPAYQDDPVTLEVHHKVPVSAGGSHDTSNLITLCERDHSRHHHTPAPTDTDEAQGVAPAVVQQATGLSDPASTEAEVYAAVASHGPVRTGQVADQVDLSAEHARHLLYQLGARDLVVPTRDGGWHLAGRVEDPPTGELSPTPSLAATRARDELLRRAAEWGLDDSDLAEIADISPRTARVAVDRAATFEVPLPDDTGNLSAVSKQPGDGETPTVTDGSQEGTQAE